MGVGGEGEDEADGEAGCGTSDVHGVPFARAVRSARHTFVYTRLGGEGRGSADRILGERIPGAKDRTYLVLEARATARATAKAEAEAEADSQRE